VQFIPAPIPLGAQQMTTSLQEESGSTLETAKRREKSDILRQNTGQSSVLLFAQTFCSTISLARPAKVCPSSAPASSGLF